MRRASFLAASLASSFAFALMARASARRVARVLRRLNRLIPAASRSSLRLVTSSRRVVDAAQHYRPVALPCGRVPAAGSLTIDSKRCTRLCDNRRSVKFAGWRCVWRVVPKWVRVCASPRRPASWLPGCWSVVPAARWRLPTPAPDSVGADEGDGGNAESGQEDATEFAAPGERRRRREATDAEPGEHKPDGRKPDHAKAR